jgi:hypothetical protein
MPSTEQPSLRVWPSLQLSYDRLPSQQRVLVTGAAGYIGEHSLFCSRGS